MAKSSKPRGLKMVRNHSTITCEWKIPNKGYGDGQQFKKGIKTATGDEKTKTNWTAVKIGDKKESEKIKLDGSLSKYYPFTNTKLKAVLFKVRGNTKKYKKKKKKINPGWSIWVTKPHNICAPKKPKVENGIAQAFSATYVIDISENFTDSWSKAGNVKKDRYLDPWTTHIEYETVLRIDKNDRSIDDIPDEIWAQNRTRKEIYNPITKDNKTEFTEPIEETPDEINQINAAINEGKTAVRWFRARALGPGGPSPWGKPKIPISYNPAKPVMASDTTAVITDLESGGYHVSVDWTYQHSINNPVDYIKIQYAFSTPTGTKKAPSADANWQEAQIGGDNTITPKSTNEAGSIVTSELKGIGFDISGHAADNQFVYVRVNTYHNNRESQGVAVICTDVDGNLPSSDGVLAMPSSLNVAPGSSNRVTVSVTNNAEGDEVYLAIVWLDVEGASKTEVIGIIECEGTGQYEETVEIPPNYKADYAIGVFAFIGEVGDPVRVGTEDSGYDHYNITTVLRSKTLQRGGAVPTAPGTVTAEHLGDGNVRVKWDWDWKDANKAIIGWSDYQYAPESTTQPNTYTVTNVNTASIIIPGLAMGKTWYFWVKLVKDSTESLWSSYAYVTLNSAPNVAYVDCSDDYITLEDEFTLTWVYVTTDTTPQKGAKIAVGSYSDGTFVPENIIETIPNDDQPGTDQYHTFDPGPDGLNWEEGKEYYISVMVESESGRSSDAWAEPYKITTLVPIECNVTSTSLSPAPQVDPEDDDAPLPYPTLTQLPLQVTIEGVLEGQFATLIVERANDFFQLRPDDSEYGGYAGETIIQKTMEGSGTFEVTLEDDGLIGQLDDNAHYNIIVQATDSYGQVKRTDPIEFIVAWDHQALMPVGSVEIDQEHLAAKIHIGIPEGYDATECAGDVCDIYRHSIDGIELIYSGAAFGETYVDPYPTLGDNGGHRIVYRTRNGDYICGLETNYAWIDFFVDEGDFVNTLSNVIDFDGERAEFMLNTDIDTSWNKNFQETKYLGGSIQGDWQSGVDRTISINTNALSNDVDTVEMMHNLAMYEGVCHIRTKDGANYTGNVNVSESAPHQPYYDREGNFTKLLSYSFNITRIDNNSEDLDGMTLAAWEATLDDE